MTLDLSLRKILFMCMGPELLTTYRQDQTVKSKLYSPIPWMQRMVGLTQTTVSRWGRRHIAPYGHWMAIHLFGGFIHPNLLVPVVASQYKDIHLESHPRLLREPGRPPPYRRPCRSSITTLITSRDFPTFLACISQPARNTLKFYLQIRPRS